jgi:hypothetical protein
MDADFQKIAGLRSEVPINSRSTFEICTQTFAMNTQMTNWRRNKPGSAKYYRQLRLNLRKIITSISLPDRQSKESHCPTQKYR